MTKQIKRFFAVALVGIMMLCSLTGCTKTDRSLLTATGAKKNLKEDTKLSKMLDYAASLDDDDYVVIYGAGKDRATAVEALKTYYEALSDEDKAAIKKAASFAMWEGTRDLDDDDTEETYVIEIYYKKA